jgi:hypothetical protein
VHPMTKLPGCSGTETPRQLRELSSTVLQSRGHKQVKQRRPMASCDSTAFGWKLEQPTRGSSSPTNITQLHQNFCQRPFRLTSSYQLLADHTVDGQFVLYYFYPHCGSCICTTTKDIYVASSRHKWTKRRRSLETHTGKMRSAFRMFGYPPDFARVLPRQYHGSTSLVSREQSQWPRHSSLIE